MDKKEKDDSIILARIIATLLVVFGHAVSPYVDGWGFTVIPSAGAAAIHAYIYSFHMPLFFFISGYVFYLAYLGKMDRFVLKNFVVNRAFRLIVPLVFVKVCILNPIFYLIGQYKSLFSFSTLFKFAHLWYLLVLFAYSILTMAVLKICGKKNPGG